MITWVECPSFDSESFHSLRESLCHPDLVEDTTSHRTRSLTLVTSLTPFSVTSVFRVTGCWSVPNTVLLPGPEVLSTLDGFWALIHYSSHWSIGMGSSWDESVPISNTTVCRPGFNLPNWSSSSYTPPLFTVYSGRPEDSESVQWPFSYQRFFFRVILE